MMRARNRRKMQLPLWLMFASALVALAFVQGSPVAEAQGAGPRVVLLTLDDAIQPISAEYVKRGFEEATGAALIVIRMDTPGGLDSSMRDIIQRIINSPIPVAVFVGPSGSRAASAGFYILQAADIAAMAPGTHAGAASPVLVNILTRSTVPLDDTMKKKIINDATAYMRSIVSKRGRNVELAEATITEARAYTAEESLKQKMIDLLAETPEALLKSLDGREITRFDGRKQTLALAGATLAKIEMTTGESFRSRVLSPDIFFILLILGVLGIYTEFTHPGLIFPGVVGAASLLLALFAANVLPINAFGFLLIALAFVLFVLEAKYTSYGLLGLAGVVSMLFGAMILIRSPWTGAGVSASVALAVTVPFALITIFLMSLVLRSRKWKLAMGPEQMPGALGEVTAEIAPGKPGQVGLQGEIWRATSDHAIPLGAAVRVSRVEGLTLHVVPVVDVRTKSDQSE